MEYLEKLIEGSNQAFSSKNLLSESNIGKFNCELERYMHYCTIATATLHQIGNRLRQNHVTAAQQKHWFKPKQMAAGSTFKIYVIQLPWSDVHKSAPHHIAQYYAT